MFLFALLDNSCFHMALQTGSLILGSTCREVLTILSGGCREVSLGDTLFCGDYHMTTIHLLPRRSSILVQRFAPEVPFGANYGMGVSEMEWNGGFPMYWIFIELHSNFRSFTLTIRFWSDGISIGQDKKTASDPL